jgi:hypothetical protein
MYELRNRFVLLIFLFLASLFPATLLAQSTQGSILGTVKDTSGAVVPGAKVTVTNTGTGIANTTTSSSAGNYQVLNLIEGSYKIQIAAQGFETEVISDLTLVARQQLRVDSALQVGALSQQVTVNAQAAGAIETETASIAATYGATDVQNLPANYRANQSGTSPLNLIQTLPGVQADSGPNAGTGVQFSVQGGLPSQTDVTVDGITTQNTTSNQPIANAFPSGESISELRVDGVLNNAEFGQPGEVTTISKSGTNQLHGSGFWYFQNSGFDSTPFGATSKPKLVGNDFGGTAGGPVVIPHLYNGHDRTFFFGTYEGFRRPGSQPYQASVPTTEMKQGNFSGVAGIQPLLDPFTGTPYPNFTVPVNSVAQKFLQFFPDPNYTGNGPLDDYTPGAINYITNQDTSLTSNQFDARGDQYFGQKAMVYGRFTWKNSTTAKPEPLLISAGSSIDQERILVLAANYNFTPHIVNEFRFGFTLDNNGTTNAFDGQSFAQSSGLQGLQNLFFNGISEMDFKFLTSLNGDRLASTTKSRTFQYLDGLTWSKGPHNMKFGFDIRHIEAVTPLSFFGADNYGTFVFNTGSNFTGLGVTPGQEFADYLIGTPQGTAYDVVTADNDGISMHYNFYAQDQWKASSRLTLSYGVRYEYHPGYHDPSGNIGNFNPAVPLSGEAIFPDGASATLNTGFLSSFDACPVGQFTGTPSENGAPCTPVISNSQAGLPTGLKNVPTKRIMPRFGFAFRPFDDDRTSIRGGFGMYNITSLGASFYSLTGTLQAATSEYANSETATGPAYAWPTIFAGQGTSSAAGNAGTAYFGTANDINWKDPYSEQYSLSVEHELKGGYGTRASYIGLETHDLVWAPNLNDLPYSNTTSAFNQPLSARPFPNWGTVNTRSTGANASYHSLQLDASHHYSHGLTFDTNYTLAKNLADNQGPNNSGFAGEVGGARASFGRDHSVDFGQVYGTRRHRWNTTMVYQLPVGRGRQFGGNMNHVADLLVGGWQLSNIFLWQSGPYLSAYFSGGSIDPSGTGSGLSKSATGGAYPARAQKPDRIGNPKPSGQNRNNWINKASFTCPGEPNWQFGDICNIGSGEAGAPAPVGRFGNSQIGDIEGPGTVNLSSGLSKSFALTEGIKLRAEGTFTNVLNHTNLADPTSLDLSSPQFGIITAARGSDFGGSRTGQVSMRLEF